VAPSGNKFGRQVVAWWVHVLIFLSIIIDLLVTWLFLSHGTNIVYQNIYFITIVLAAYYYHHKGVFITIGLTAVYLGITYYYFPDATTTLQSVFRAIIFIFIAFIVSYLAEHLEGERKKYYTIFATTESGMALVVRSDQAVLEANDRFKSTIGQVGDGKILLSKVLGEADLVKVSEAIANGHRLTSEKVSILAADSSVKICLVSGHPLTNAQYFISMEDVTERYQAEEALRQNEESMRMIFESTPYPLVLTSMDTGKIINMNQKAQSFFELDAGKEYSNEGINFYTDPVDREKVLEQMIINGFVDNLEMQLRTNKGAKKWVIVTTRSTIHQGQRCLLTALYDITERKRMEHSLEQANAKLSLLNSITRHDIVNQAVALNGYIELLSKRSTDADMVRSLDRMRRATENISRQISFTKDYQELGTKAAEMYDVKDAFETAFREANPAGLLMETPNSSYVILADRMLGKVFYNLIDNSCRHGEHVTRVKLDFVEYPDRLDVIYSDDGCGISETDHVHLFEKGFGKNTGLGMFLTKEILAITSVEIIETGRPGEGVRFELRVPKGNYRRVGA